MSHIGGLGEAIEVQVAAPVEVGVADFDDALQASEGLVVNLVLPEQYGVIAEVAQEPVELPESPGSAIESGGKAASSKLPGLDD